MKVARLAIGAPNWVGDLVMATPVLEAAARAPHVGRLSVLVRRHLAPLLADGPLAPLVRVHAGAGDELAALRSLAPDAVLLLSNSFGAAWRAWRAGIPVRAGSALSARRLLLTHAVLPPSSDNRRFPIPTAHLHRDVAGLAGVLVDDLHPHLGVRDELRERQRALLGEAGLAPGEEYAVCCPGAAFGAAKLWPPERFAAVLDRLHDERGWRGVVTGGPGEEPLVEAVAACSRRRAVSLAKSERNLELLKALVRDARLMLVGDSGPRWVAAAFDVPCVTILGPNVPELTATSLERCEVVRLELECSPCAQRTCPLGHHRCMQGLAVEAVAAAVQRVLARAEVP